MSYSPDTVNPHVIPAVNSGLKRYKGKWTSEEARHLLKRTLFGASQQDIVWMAGRSMDTCIAQLLHTPEDAPAPPINNYNDDKYVDTDIPAGDTWINALKTDGMQNGRRINSWKSWWLNLMLNQQRTLREKMVVFWHNHFVTESRSVGQAVMCYRNNVLLRQYALGNFRQLVKGITKDMAMLRYLNGAASTKKAPDENYGRELQELFTIGKGPGSHYTEADVKAAARVLTGFTIDYKTMQSQFVPGRHDDTDKQFSAFYHNRIIKGRKGAAGEEELDELLDMLLENEEVSLFLCRKLYRYFVYHSIDEATEKHIIAPLAKTFRKNNYEIKPVLEQLLQSRHFYDGANRGAIIKSPLDFTVGLWREYNVSFPPAIDIAEKHALLMQLAYMNSIMQQDIGDPPNVAGWPAWYQAPQYDKIWVNSDTLPKRNQFTDRMLNNGMSRGECKANINAIQFAQQVSDPANPDTLINESIQMLYMTDLSAKEKEYLKTAVLLSGLQGKMSDHYWTQAWQNMMAKPEDKAATTIVNNRLKALYKYLMNLPQYQLC